MVLDSYANSITQLYAKNTDTPSLSHSFQFTYGSSVPVATVTFDSAVVVESDIDLTIEASTENTLDLRTEASNKEITPGIEAGRRGLHGPHRRARPDGSSPRAPS